MMHGTRMQAGAAGGRARLFLCAVLTLLWFVCSVAAALPGGKLETAAAGLQAVFLIAFVVTHASGSNGWRGFGAYAVITLVVSGFLEANSIAHGFPFGFYVHNMPGPKPFGVPPAVLIGYVILGWLAWTLARLLTRAHPGFPANRFTTPLAAAFIVTGYDFTYDPIGSTVLHMWTYRSPSGYFGVPLSNFLGWMFMSWVLFQLFALVEHRFPPRSDVGQARMFWLLPCFIWAATALQYPIKYAYAPDSLAVVGTRSFVIADIYAASIVSAMLTMVFVALLAAMKIWPGTGRATPAA